ncbi:hypothetical protein Ancab_018814 [Ancistrocladus abbreviatus]
MEPFKSRNWLLSACIFSLLFSSSLSAATSSCKGGLQSVFMTSDVKEVAGKSYDYIVVGGGTSGCPLAATLSQKFSVLVIERGGSPYGNPLILNKEYFGLPLLQLDEFSSAAQAFVSSDGVPNVRGRVLGGSTAINGGFYSRASKDFVENAGWDEILVKDAYTWVESKLVSEPELSPWQFIVMDGLLEAGVLPFNGFTLDHVAGTKISGTIYDIYGMRHTAADLLGQGNLQNITVLLNATVNKVIFKDDGGKPRASGVEFMRSNGSMKRTCKVHLKKSKHSSSWGDVILSAGALGSPQILMLSGIGPKRQLQKLNVPIVAYLGGVGKQMQDNPAISLLVDSQPQWREPDPPRVTGITDDYQIIVQSEIVPISENLTRISIAAKLAFPASRGKLELNSTDPRENPVVRFNYLAKEQDLQLCVKLGHLLDQVATSASVTLFLGNQHKNSMKLNDEEMRERCKKNVRTFYHYHGGCTVGSVVDKEYRVYGVEGLRVVDGSTLLESPGTNPMATLLMLGRYQGVRILKERTNSA